MLQLFLGGAGTGKSRQILDLLIERSVHEPERRFYLLVPEQYTMGMQREMVRRHPRGGSMNLDVLSFHRLACRLLEESGRADVTLLDDLGKGMLLRRVLRRRRSELAVFGASLDKPGFFEQLKSMLSELFQYGITREDLDGMIEATADVLHLARKLKDVAVAYDAFREGLSEDTIPSEELLSFACAGADGSALLRGSVIALDGFTGFTPLQMAMIERVMPLCDDIYASVTLDPEVLELPPQAESLFSLSRETVEKLRRAAGRAGIQERPPVLLSEDHRHKAAPSLQLLTRSVLRLTARESQEVPGEIELVSAPDMLTEAQAAASKIRTLCRTQGYRYRDIAVVCSDLAGYAHVISRAFGDAGIPCFLDSKVHLEDHPCVALIAAALETVREGWKQECVLRFIRSPYSPLTREEADEVERYAMALGVRGRKGWTTPWTRGMKNIKAPDLARLNALRERAVTPLADFAGRMMGEEKKGGDRLRHLLTLLQDVHMEEKLAAAQEAAEKENREEEAMLHGQTYGLLMGLLDRVYAVLGDEEVSFAEFHDVIETGLSEVKAGVLPGSDDRVVVGDMERSRLGAVRALFFLGLNEGKVPRAAGHRGILSDRDRELLSRRKIELSPSVRKSAYIQRFYLYLTLSAASERLYLSYAQVGADGSEQPVSSLLGEIRGIFPALSARPVGFAQLTGSEPTARPYLLDEIRRLREGEETPRHPEILAWYACCKAEKYDSLVESALSGYYKEMLTPEAVRRLYGDVLRMSVTRLEGFSACAFAYFLNHGLKLKPREERSFERSDVGTVLHEAAAAFLGRMIEEGWTVEEARARLEEGVCRQIVAESAAAYGGGLLEEDAVCIHEGERILRMTERTVWALLKQMESGGYRPYAVEMPFSPEDAKSLRLELSPEEVMLLDGRIDRLDICESGDSIYVKIVDFKTRGKKFSDAETYEGLMLQLPYYLNAACEILKKRYPDRRIVPAAMEYVSFEDPFVDVPADAPAADTEPLLLDALRPNAVLTSEHAALEAYDASIMDRIREKPDLAPSKAAGKGRTVLFPHQMEHLIEFVKEKTASQGRRILAGDITVDPYQERDRSSCTYCPFSAVCGIDPRRPGYRFRRLEIPDKEVLYGKEEP
ncbi:MAG: PD-(D/E)XK nuclease family protein [Lachnospiraceae bacterium]|nr:PD-(D/E)XK nuclease family protein [Lachnospiraceae bacterium]